nr:DUF5682 family protein [Proteus sp. G4415]
MKWTSLQQQHLYFAPVRHHSPACAYAVLSLIDSVKPDYILIEGPDTFNSLIPSLTDKDTLPPVAIMGQAEYCHHDSGLEEREKSLHSAYFPFCEYSPEWQALRGGLRINATTRFIDLPWAAQVNNEEYSDLQSRSLQKERYLAHSQFIAQLAKQCHCRDHDDVWEHLFELRSIEALADWQTLFNDIFIWCALARLDYEPEVLASEGSSQREAHMLTHIKTIKQHEPNAKILIVTGGAHTLALIEGLASSQPHSFAISSSEQKHFTKMQKMGEKEQAWQSLMQQHHDKLENNEAAKQPTQVYRNKMGIAFLSSVAQTIREQQFDNPPSYLTVKLAAEQSLRLALLREHTGMGRYDLLDGLQSAFIKGSLDDSQNELWDEIKTCFSGYLLGQIPLGTATPPLVNETYERAKAFRFKLDDTLAKTTKCDVYRNPQHRLRSRFLHLLAFLEIHFAHRVNGPDFLSGHQLDLLFEEWQYAWTPNVEGELISLSEKGSQLETIALNKLLAMEKQLAEQGQSRSSQSAVTLLIQAALIGLHQRIPTLFKLLDSYIQQDFRLESLTQCGHKLIHLWRGRQYLDITDELTLENRLHQVIPQAFFCLEQLAQGDEQQQESNLQALLSLRELIEFMPSLDHQYDYKSDFYQQLNRLDGQLDTVPLLKGAVDALRYLGSYIDEKTLAAVLNATFSTGSSPEHAIGYFVGIMRTAPELVIRLPLLVNHLNSLLQQWDEERFIQILPDLRFAFSQLNPKQNAELAQYIANDIGLDTQALSLWQSEFSAKQMLEATKLNQKLQQRIKTQGMISWFEAKKTEKGDHTHGEA